VKNLVLLIHPRTDTRMAITMVRRRRPLMVVLEGGHLYLPMIGLRGRLHHPITEVALVLGMIGYGVDGHRKPAMT
jgi:hypothetical protein